ncbi:MAG: transcriptional regulator with XRE-family HTH domain [Clostridium sp.]|jgi:transcriptional regulator with XRE-family HTH domain
MFNTEPIEIYLKRRGWTKYRLAKESGIGQSTLSEILSGKKKNPSIETLQKISTALGVPMSTLIVDNSFSLGLICALQSAYHNNSHDGELHEVEFWKFISGKLSINYDELSTVVLDRSVEYSIETQLKLIDDFKEIDNERFLDFAKYNTIPAKPEVENSIIELMTSLGMSLPEDKLGQISMFDNNYEAIKGIPSQFTDSNEARDYINMHQMFAAEGFNLNEMSDEDVLDFANEILNQIKLISYKYKK